MTKTLLHEAANGIFDKVLATSDVDALTSTDSRGSTLLHWAAAHGHESAASYLAKILPRDMLNQTDETGWTALDYAQHYKHDDLALNLIVQGVNEGRINSTNIEEIELPELNSDTY